MVSWQNQDTINTLAGVATSRVKLISVRRLLRILILENLLRRVLDARRAGEVSLDRGHINKSRGLRSRGRTLCLSFSTWILSPPLNHYMRPGKSRNQVEIAIESFVSCRWVCQLTPKFSVPWNVVGAACLNPNALWTAMRSQKRKGSAWRSWHSFPGLSIWL